jgi:hypothetical protein
MSHACSLQHCPVHMVYLLIDRYFSLAPESQNINSLRMALINACKSGHGQSVEIVNRLLNGALNSGHPAENLLEVLKHLDHELGNTCMMFACAAGKLELLETLWVYLRRFCTKVQLFGATVATLTYSKHRKISQKSQNFRLSLLIRYSLPLSTSILVVGIILSVIASR